MTEAVNRIENVEVLETYLVARDFPTSINKTLSSEGLTPGMFLNNHLSRLVALQGTLEELIGSKIKMPNIDTPGTSLKPGLTENLRLRYFHKLDMPSILRTIDANFPSASRSERSLNSDADSAATNNLLVSLDSASNSAAIKFYRGLSLPSPRWQTWFL